MSKRAVLAGKTNKGQTANPTDIIYLVALNRNRVRLASPAAALSPSASPKCTCIFMNILFLSSEIHKFIIVTGRISFCSAWWTTGRPCSAGLCQCHLENRKTSFRKVMAHSLFRKLSLRISSDVSIWVWNRYYNIANRWWIAVHSTYTKWKTMKVPRAYTKRIDQCARCTYRMWWLIGRTNTEM